MNRGWIVALAILALSVSLTAQRGGGGRGNQVPTAARTSYENPAFGIKFSVPSDMYLYTPDQPGSYRGVFADRRIAYLVNPTRPEETIGVKYTEGVTEADLASYQALVESNPPQAKLPGFKKLDIAKVSIGKGGVTSAVNFIYEMTSPGTDKDPALDMTVRQLTLIHKGRGFTITCQTSRKRFDKANKDTFDKFLSRFEFQ